MKRSHDVARAKTNENGEKLKTNHNVCTLRNGSFAEESEEITIEHGESKEADDVGESTRSDENGDGNDTFVNENEVVIMKGGSKEPDENGESAEGGESGDRNVSFAKAHQNSFAKPYEDIPHNFCVEEDDGGDTFDENDTLRIARKKIEHDIEMGIPMPSLPGVSNAVQRKNKIASVVDDLAKSTSRSASAHRAHRAHRRRTNSSRALPAGQRLAVDVKNFFGMSVDNYMGDVEFHSSKHGRYNISSRSLMHSTPQYCLQAMKPPTPPRPRLLRWLGFADARVTIYEDTTPSARCCGVNPNLFVINFLHWMFRQTFMTVILTAVFFQFVFTILFALFILRAGSNHPECIGGLDFHSEKFINAFVLSWTTFTTVGYGMIYPATSQSGVDVRHCTMMSIVTSLEAFIGVLFASVCGAIIFIKVSRIQSFAQVEFSDPVCIRYGMGVKIECDDDCIDSDNGSQSYECGSDNLPCPILEFRVVNRMHNVPGGEIIDASVNVVACIDASQACPTLKDSLSQRREGKKGKKRVVRNRGALMRRLVSLNGSSLANLDQSSRDALTMSSTNRTRELSTDSIFSKFSRGKRMKDVSTGSLSSRFDADFSKATTLSRQNQAFEEDPSGHLVPKIILSKLKCETQNHPFFKRVFIVRHTLDRHSPLLKAEPRQLIKQNHGCWPNELNSPECVRDSIHFDQLLISLTGTSNADANTVYAQHVYDFVDVHVGYRFVNMMYREPGDETLLVDKSLLNDVMEQAGGGGETFAWDHALKEKEILVL